MKREQRQRAIAAGLSPSSPHAQLRYDFADRDALADAFKLVFSFLDRTPTISAADKDKLDAFLRRFLPLVFAFGTTDFALSLLPVAGADDDNESLDGASDAGTSIMDDVSEGASVVNVKRGGKKSGGDLRKKVLKNAGPGKGRGGDFGRRSKVSSPAPSSRAASPALSAADTTDGDVSMADVPLPTDLSTLASLLAPAADGAVETLVEAAALTGESSTSDGSVGMMVDEAASPVVDAVEVFESSAGALEQATIMESLPEVIVPVDDRPPRVDVRRQWNVFANSNMYCMLRLLQVRFFVLPQRRETDLVTRSSITASRSSRSRPSLSPVLPLLSRSPLDTSPPSPSPRRSARILQCPRRITTSARSDSANGCSTAISTRLRSRKPCGTCLERRDTFSLRSTSSFTGSSSRCVLHRQTPLQLTSLVHPAEPDSPRRQQVAGSLRPPPRRPRPPRPFDFAATALLPLASRERARQRREPVPHRVGPGPLVAGGSATRQGQRSDGRPPDCRARMGGVRREVCPLGRDARDEPQDDPVLAKVRRSSPERAAMLTV